VLLFLGRLAYVKGCDLLLHAFAEVSRTEPSLHLVMCGPDFEGWKPSLTRLSERLSITHQVTWVGPLY
jgi:glycosyltransferase involved in cell wall biosynthesis